MLVWISVLQGRACAFSEYISAFVLWPLLFTGGESALVERSHRERPVE